MFHSTDKEAGAPETFSSLLTITQPEGSKGGQAQSSCSHLNPRHPTGPLASQQVEAWAGSVSGAVLPRGVHCRPWGLMSHRISFGSRRSYR